MILVVVESRSMLMYLDIPSRTRIRLRFESGPVVDSSTHHYGPPVGTLGRSVGRKLKKIRPYSYTSLKTKNFVMSRHSPKFHR